MTNAEKMEILENRFHSLLADAEALFNVDLFHVKLRTDLTGYTLLGEAVMQGDEMSIRINKQCIEHYFDDVIGDTLPHEVAHIVQYARGSKGGHGQDWKDICVALGYPECTRVATKEYPLLKPARKMRMWSYWNSEGTITNLTTVRHNKLQKDKVMGFIVVGGGKITKADFIEEYVA